MKAFALCVLVSISVASGCKATEQSEASNTTASAAETSEAAASGAALRHEIDRRARAHNGGKEPTKLELFNELLGKAQEQAGAGKNYGKPRVVARGARPEIVVKGSQVIVNGNALAVGVSDLNEWRGSLGPESRHETGTYVLYLWDRLGITLVTNADGNKITQFDVALNLEPKEPWIPTRPDGSSKSEPPDYRPKSPFPGYLELDGHGIDAKTKFWEIRASADPKRNLRCNPRDCSHPHGRFSDSANLYLRLNSATEYGNLYEFTISGNEKASADNHTAK
jgi:hypothetical protein